jgi:hypothetical protein
VSNLLDLLTGEENPIAEIEVDDEDDPDYYEEPEPEADGRIISYKTKRLILDMYDGTNGQKRRTFESIARLYDWLTRVHIQRFRAKLEGSGTRAELLKLLGRRVYTKFLDARKKMAPVHGRMICRWALIEAPHLNLTTFRASPSWLLKFKRRYGIVSRKITSYIGRAKFSSGAEIAESIANFSLNYSMILPLFTQDRIFNFDQTGFNYEPANLRTLSLRGERDTNLLLESRNKATHSYTTQPMISRSGLLYPKLLVCLQERSVPLSPEIRNRLDEIEKNYGNLEVVASTSGKMSSYLINQWYDRNLIGLARDAVNISSRGLRSNNSLGEPSIVVLADSWSGHSAETMNEKLNKIGVRLLRIPPGTTDKIQPLDVNFNRQLKIFYNRIMEEAFYKDMMKDLTSREGILNVQSLMHDQLGSPKYREMIQWAWRNTDPGFNESFAKPPPMVQRIQFDIDPTETCMRRGCDEHAFIRCSHCARVMCLAHFVGRVCVHNQLARNKRSMPTCKPSHEIGEPDECPDDTEATSSIDELESSSPLRTKPVHKLEEVVTGVGELILGGNASGAHELGTAMLSHSMTMPLAMLGAGIALAVQHKTTPPPIASSTGSSGQPFSTTKAPARTTKKARAGTRTRQNGRTRGRGRFG